LAADYGKNLFNHNQLLIAENEKLKAKIAKIESETANKYLGVIDGLKEALEAVMQRCAELEELVAKQATEIDRLRKQLWTKYGRFYYVLRGRAQRRAGRFAFQRLSAERQWDRIKRLAKRVSICRQVRIEDKNEPSPFCRATLPGSMSIAILSLLILLRRPTNNP
jgi:uncharacterized coiled-coil protein SlyX